MNTNRYPLLNEQFHKGCNFRSEFWHAQGSEKSYVLTTARLDATQEVQMLSQCHDYDCNYYMA